MRKLRLSDLPAALRSFLAGLKQNESLAIEDDAGQLQFSITPYTRATPEERQQAWRRIQQIQQKVAVSLQKQGVTEDDVMQVLLEDD